MKAATDISFGRTLLLAVFITLAAAGLPALPGCGGSQASRSATISSVDTGVVALVRALRQYEHIQAEKIIASATSLNDGKVGLAALRAKTTTAWRALDTAFAALDVANTINDDPSIQGARRALDDAVAAVTAITGGAP